MRARLRGAACSAPGLIRVTTVDEVDLLFVVDNSSSVLDEQAALAAELPRMIRILASGDVDEDGDDLDESDFDGARDLDVGVITTDMGALGNALPTCDRPEFGDDGILRTQGAHRPVGMRRLVSEHPELLCRRRIPGSHRRSHPGWGPDDARTTSNRADDEQSHPGWDGP